MKTVSTISRGKSPWAAAWQHVGSGILVAMMFVILASSAMLREHSALAGIAGGNADDGLFFRDRFNGFHPGQDASISHSVQLTLPLPHLRESDGRMTPNGESFFRLLARRMKSLSLCVMLTTSSIDDAEFATTIAAHMMSDVSLDSTQIRISSDGRSALSDTQRDAVLIVTITRQETLDGDAE